MAYTTPPTFVASDVLTAADLNVLSDDIIALHEVGEGVTFYGVKLSKTSQSISDSAYTNINWATEVYDYGSWWSSGVYATVPAGAIPAGYTTIACHVIANVRWAANGTGSRRVSLQVNGSEVAYSSLSGLAGDTLGMVINDYVHVVSGDQIKIQVYQSSGGSLTLDYAYLTIVRHGPVA